MPGLGHAASGAQRAADFIKFAAGPSRRVQPRHRGLWMLAALVAGAWLCGLAFFINAQGIVAVALAERDPAPAGEHNLASWRFGVAVRASSYHKDLLNQHHPLFVIDGRDEPTLVEKWTSDAKDPAPWIEIRWRQPRTLSQVVLVHAGAHEEPALTVRNYSITCLRDGAVGPTINIEGNTASVVRHDLPCADARGIRWQVDRQAPGEVVRLYEVEALGR